MFVIICIYPNKHLISQIMEPNVIHVDAFIMNVLISSMLLFLLLFTSLYILALLISITNY